MTGQEPGTQPPPQPPSGPDWNALVPIKVDGVEQMLTLREVANGYAAGSKMHEATTRAAQMEQELEKHRNMLDQIDADPGAFVEKLVQTYGLSDGATTSGGTGDEINPLAATVARLEAQIGQLANGAQAQQQLTAQQQQLAALSSNDGFDKQALMAYAATKGVDNLEHAWLMMQGEQGAAAAPPSAHTPYQDALDVLAERKAASLGAVSPGASTAPAGQHEQPPGPAASTAEALQRALTKNNSNMDELMTSITGV